MRITIKSQPEIRRAELLRQARRTAALALGRFSSRIERVTIRLADAEVPCGGSQKLTTIAVEGRRSWQVQVRHFALDWPTSLSGAARRARHAVARALDPIRWSNDRGAA